MKELLMDINLSIEEIEMLKDNLENIGCYKLEKVINVFKQNHCSNNFIRELIINRQEVFDMDIDRIILLIEAILANGDLIDEVFFELI